MASHALYIAFSVLGTLTGIFMAFAPLPVIRQIDKDQDGSRLSYYPYLFYLCNSVVWSAFGLRTADLAVSIANVISLLVCMHCCLVLYSYTPKKVTAQIVTQVFCGATSLFFCLFCLVPKLMPHFDKALQIAGMFYVFLLYGSPLLNSWHAIKQKSVLPIPIFSSVGVVVNSSTWVIYGFSSGIYSIVICNALGVVVGSFMICLYIFLVRKYKDTAFTNNTTTALKEAVVDLTSTEFDDVLNESAKKFDDGNSLLSQDQIAQMKQDRVRVLDETI